MKIGIGQSDGKAHRTNSYFGVIIHFNHQGISLIIMPGSGKKNRTDGKSINQLPDNLSGKGDRKSKHSRTAVAASTPSTV